MSTRFTVALENKPVLPPNERTATIAMLAALISPLPLLLILLAAWFRQVPIYEVQGWAFVLMIIATPYLAIIGVGAAVMALDGKLTLYIGVAVGVGYTLGVLSLAGGLMIFLTDQVYSPWGWFCIVPAALAAVGSLFVIYRRRQRRAAALLQTN